jgi:hypothetical protein
VLNDVERLCNVHIPQWLQSSGMSADKIAAFYDDPVKQACDLFSIRKAYNLKAFSIDTGLVWRLRRWVKFFIHLGRGVLRRFEQARPAEARPAMPTAPQKPA